MEVTALLKVLWVFGFFGGVCCFCSLRRENYRVRCTKEMGFLKSIFMQTVEEV